MASKNQPKSYTPKDGGALVSRADWPLTGFPNYTVKLDFRRDYDQEIRREGNDWFHPNLDAEIGNQPYPQRQSHSVGLTNGAFELDDNQNGIPDGWVVVTSLGIAFARDTVSAAAVFSGRFRPGITPRVAPATTSATGSFSARFTSSLAIAQGWIETENFFPATPGKSWVLNFQHKVSVPTFKVLVEVQWYNHELELLSTSTIYSNAVGNPTSFQGMEKRAVVPQGAFFGKVRFYGKDATDPTTGQIWYDGVSLYEAEEGTKPIILLHQARRPNGQTAVIAGTDETLYRWRAADEGDYIEDEGGGAYVADGYLEPDYINDGSDPNYVDDDYITNQEGMWEIIGDNFDPSGERWEAVNINGWAIFNNAADLPQTFRVEDNQVFPNYEMREAGIALVGTITDYVGSLICGDIALIKEDQLDKVFAHEDSGLGTLREHGAPNSSPFTIRASNGGAVDLGATGSGRNVSVLDHADLRPGTNWAVEAVVKLAAVPANGSFYTIWGKSQSFRFSVEAIDGLYYMRLETWHGGVYSGVPSVTPIAPGQWTHLAVVVDPALNRVTFFREGLPVDFKLGAPAAPDVNANSLFSGAGAFTGPTNATGGMQIAELRHWIEKRTNSQILEFMSADVSDQPKLGGYWKFDETGGTSAADSSGSLHTGTLNAGAVFIVSDAAVDSFLIVTPVAATTGGLTRSGTTATFTCAVAHKLTTGQLVKISGAADASYNGLFPVTVTGPLTFTYTIAGAPASPDPGSPVVQRALFGTAAFNYEGMVGKQIFPLNGWRSRISAIIDPVKIKVTRSTIGWTGDQVFVVINDVPIPLTGTVNKNGTVNVVGAPETLFTKELYPGASIMIPGGIGGDEIRVVATITDDHALTVTKAFVGTASIQDFRQMSDYLLISDVNYFEPEMVGRKVFFDDGSARTITRFVNPRWVETDSFMAVTEQQFMLENTAAYGPIKNASLYDRIQYRRVWSDIDEPLRFAAATLGTINLGSRVLNLRHQRRSFKIGDSILIVGAGTAGGNLTATIAYIHPNHTSIILDRAAETTSVEQPVARSDASGSISGFDDLQDDGSPIVKMLDLRGTLVSYKETAIFLTTYTGDPNAPFTAIRRYQGSKTPFYRDTLINVEGRFHLYSGRTSFYSYDLVAQSPEEFNPLEACLDLFYSQVRLENRKLIFSFRNVVTKEIFFCFPSTSIHSALCYDFNRTNLAPIGTVSTTGEHYTAGAWIKKPLGGPIIGMTPDWVILGGPTGIVMRYGKADDPDEQFGNSKAMFNRLGSGYESRLKGGLYGDRFHETTMSEWMAELATQDYPTITSYTFNLYGYRNSAEAPRLVMTTPLPLPATANLVPMLFREHFFQDEIVVTGANNPLRLAARTVVFSKQGSRGVGKAGLV